MITLCGPLEVKSKMFNQQEKIQNVFTCPKCGRSLACYVGTGYSNPYKNLQGLFGVDFCTVIYETNSRSYIINAQSISTLLSRNIMNEYYIHDWVEMVIKKSWPFIWVKDEDI